MDKLNPNFYKHLEDDSEMIQAAVDAAAEIGGTVTIPRHNERTGENIWHIARAIQLHTGSVVCLDNCVLRQVDGMMENIFTNSNNNVYTGEISRETRQYDIKIYGLGNALLDGGNHNGLLEPDKYPGKPPMYVNCPIHFVNVERVKVDNLRIVNQRYWAITFQYCAHGHVSNIDFYATHNWINQDGINLRTGCSHFIIENITGCTGDDTVAMTNLRCHYDKAAKAAGLDDAIHHVIVRNICTSTPCCMVRTLNHHRKLIYDVVIENIVSATERNWAHQKDLDRAPLDPDADQWRVGACVRLGENRYYGDDEANKAVPGEAYNITVRNVITRARVGIRASCALDNVLIDNVQVFGDGGTAVHFGEGIVKNVRVSNIGYAMKHAPRDIDDNRKEKGMSNMDRILVPHADRKLCAVYFDETEAENIVVSNMFAGRKLTSVFGGTGNVSLIANNIIREDTNVPLFDDTLTVTKAQADSF